MPSVETYMQRAKAARKQANACRDEYERQGLLIIADQCERIASYKNLTGSPSRVTAAAKAALLEADTRNLHSSPATAAATKQQAPIILSAKP